MDSLTHIGMNFREEITDLVIAGFPSEAIEGIYIYIYIQII